MPDDQRRSHTSAFVRAAFAVVVWGASFIATKIALGELSPMVLVFLRFGIGVAVLGAFVSWRGGFTWIHRSDVGLIALLGFLGIAFHQWLQSNGLQTSQATTTAWIITTIPVFMAALGFFFLRERLDTLRIIGIVIAMAGVVLIVTKGDFGLLFAGSFGAPGDTLALISAPNWAVFSILSRRALKRHSPTNAMFFVMAFGWMMTALFVFVTDGVSVPWQLVMQTSIQGWCAVLFLGLFCSGVAYIFWYDALTVLPASRVGALLYIEPLVTMVVAAILLDEAIVAVSIVGGLFILFGVWLVNRPAVTRSE